MARRVLRMASWGMAALFLLAVAVQYNDPDPLRWMAIYAAGAGIAVCFALGRVHPLPAWLTAVAAAAWAATIVPRVAGSVGLARSFATIGMPDAGAEEMREMVGLALVAAWSAVAAVNARPRA